MSDKIRLDALMVKKQLVSSRERAKTLILNEQVFIAGKKAEKASQSVNSDAQITIVGDTLKYVSRGGLKLEKAINEFAIDLTGSICMDVGASTGGFTDCMLQNGASYVYAVDVGSDQLAQNLKVDARVLNLEKTNIKDLSTDMVRDKIDFVSIDVSFISVKIVLSAIKAYLKDDAHIVCLVKPQFEAGRENVGKNGVVRDKKIHSKVFREVFSFALQTGYGVLGASFSPIKGPRGNIEYLLYLKNNGTGGISADDIEEVVRKSHEKLA